MRQSDSSSSKMSLQPESYSDNDSDYYEHDHDPGRDVIEKNLRNRLQRMADYTQDELNKVLKRVDKVRRIVLCCSSNEKSFTSSLDAK